MRWSLIITRSTTPIRWKWRFGQSQTVHVHVVSADTEGAVVENIRRKDAQHSELSAAMMKHMRELTKKSVLGAQVEKTDYLPQKSISIPAWLHSA